MLQLEQKAGRNVPLLLCDSCGTRITAGSDASVLYQSSASSDSDSQVLFAHNGSCKDVLEESLGDRYVGSDNLGQYLTDLAAGVRLKPGNPSSSEGTDPPLTPPKKTAGKSKNT